MAHSHSDSSTPPSGILGRWNAIPLYFRILIAMAVGVAAGMLLGDQAEFLEVPSTLILQLLGALAPPLILAAVVHVLMTSEITGATAARLVSLLLLNTMVAIIIGLAVANIMQPGKAAKLEPPPTELAHFVEQMEKHSAELTQEEAKSLAALQDSVETLERAGIKSADAFAELRTDEVSALLGEQGLDKAEAEQLLGLVREKNRSGPFGIFLESIPKSIAGPLGDGGNVIGVIFIAIAFGLAFRSKKDRELRTLKDFVEIAYESLIEILHWIIHLVTLGVFAIVARVVGVEGFGVFKALFMFILAVLIALALQTLWYLLRIQFFSWAKPLDVVKGVRDALVMAFSTDSSTVTMPVTFACLKDNVGLREESASMGALVGANFNNDGTALYEAMAALFIAQYIGQDLSLLQQGIVVLTSIVASIGAAGIPEAGLVTMTLVFNAVGLPPENIAILLTVDWFLDRCRTTINVLGDVNVSCILDGMTPPNDSTAVASG
ncbi:MAG: dicarboxylate/amino acid:cation symporter [Planctomycetota bacterium]